MKFAVVRAGAVVWVVSKSVTAVQKRSSEHHVNKICVQGSHYGGSVVGFVLGSFHVSFPGWILTVCIRVVLRCILGLTANPAEPVLLVLIVILFSLLWGCHCRTFA